ncbi:hypothetical protein [Acidovorax sp.]|uniref:hypothetical protein n=1 Tax=Acidovorax sp. TaxID=1872122 RepID=UPI002621E472|nr:hypothetical protein [Acidovorax sp.]HQT18911.1 hypothetical protein [Acidovorax defluvii]HQT51619.1 hypothetical protein [Acidovorax defluvii]
MKINIQASLFGLGLVVFYISSFASLTTEGQDSAAIVKYMAIVWIAANLVLTQRKKATDFVAFFGLIFFCLMTIIFTLLNLEGVKDVIVASGYVVCALIFYLSSKNSKKITLLTRMSLIIPGLVFLVINLFYIFDSTAYTIHKNQFTGFLSNANALAGLLGLFCVVFIVEFNGAQERKLKLLFLVAFGLCGFLLFLAGSRGAILSVFLVLIYLILKFKSGDKFLLFGVLLAIISITYYIASASQFSGADRDLFEESGRQGIFAAYMEKFSENYFVLGTGVSQDAGRIKSELSYFDILLFSGVGSIGFFLFLISSLRQATRVKDEHLMWASASFIYIFIISFFEGYAANIASIPSLLFYLLPGIIYYNNKN